MRRKHRFLASQPARLPLWINSSPVDYLYLTCLYSPSTLELYIVIHYRSSDDSGGYLDEGSCGSTIWQLSSDTPSRKRGLCRGLSRSACATKYAGSDQSL